MATVSYIVYIAEFSFNLVSSAYFVFWLMTRIFSENFGEYTPTEKKLFLVCSGSCFLLGIALSCFSELSGIADTYPSDSDEVFGCIMAISVFLGWLLFILILCFERSRDKKKKVPKEPAKSVDIKSTDSISDRTNEMDNKEPDFLQEISVHIEKIDGQLPTC